MAGSVHHPLVFVQPLVVLSRHRKRDAHTSPLIVAAMCPAKIMYRFQGESQHPSSHLFLPFHENFGDTGYLPAIGSIHEARQDLCDESCGCSLASASLLSDQVLLYSPFFPVTWKKRHLTPFLSLLCRASIPSEMWCKTFAALRCCWTSFSWSALLFLFLFCIFFPLFKA